MEKVNYFHVTPSDFLNDFAYGLKLDSIFNLKRYEFS